MQSSESAPAQPQRLKRMLVAGLAVLVFGCVAAPAAFAAPDFTWAPDPAVACEQVTFTPSLDTEGAMWDYENNDTFVSELMHAFQTEGTHTVEMTSTNGLPVMHDVIVGNAPPVASFDYSPTQPDPGEWIVFDSSASSDCDDSVQTFEWDFHDGTTSTEANPVHKFANAGPHDVTLTVTDADLATDSVTQQVDVRDPSEPSASFQRDPGDTVLLETGQAATFTSDSTASPNSTLTWDVDGDGFDDGTGDELTTSFATPGTKVVRLRVEQPNGKSDVATSVFRVNAPPVAGFVWAPTSPVAGAQVQLFSTSVDAEGALAGEAWELDGDGDFDDASGPSAVGSFSAGDHEVSLRVTDGDGVSRTITRTITVAAPVEAPIAPIAPNPPPPAPAKPALMSPFPTVRLVGLVVPRGARITLVEVRGGPRGARVTVRCTGRGCPFRSRRRVVGTRRVRLSNFPRVLAAGARIEVLVRAPGVIGKYVRWRMRAGKRPVRTDRCLMPGASEPTRCT